MAKKHGAHKTVHSSLQRSIDDLAAIEGVDRIIIGISKGTRHHRPVGSLKIQCNVDTGIRLVGYSDRGISEFTVITSDIVKVRTLIEERFSID